MTRRSHERKIEKGMNLPTSHALGSHGVRDPRRWRFHSSRTTVHLMSFVWEVLLRLRIVHEQLIFKRILVLSTTNLLLLNDALLPAGDGEQGGFRLVVHLAILPSCA